MFVQKNGTWYVAGINRTIHTGLSDDPLLKVKIKYDLPLDKIEICRTEVSASAFVPSHLSFIAAAGRWDPEIARWARENGITPMNLPSEVAYKVPANLLKPSAPPALLEAVTLQFQGNQPTSGQLELRALTAARQVYPLPAGTVQYTYGPRAGSKDFLLTVKVQSQLNCTVMVPASQLIKNKNIGSTKTPPLVMVPGPLTATGTMEVPVLQSGQTAESSYTLTLQGTVSGCK